MSSRAAVPQSFGRFAFLLLWSLVTWGALLIASAVTDAFTEGSIAFARLFPTREATFWGWLGAFCVLLALGAGLLGSAFLVSKASRTGDE
jgi:hypothetical protein